MIIKTYDHLKTLESNIKSGPYWKSDLPKIPKIKKSYNLLNQKLESPFGIPACPLTINAKYIKLFSNLGFDLLTYKSVRSREWKAHRYPNWVYVDVKKPLKSKDLNKELVSGKTFFLNQSISTANSFGISSQSPSLWIKDYKKAVKSLHVGQVLILSIMLSHIKSKTLIEDAKELAQYVLKTPAQIIELNLSCPNVKNDGLIYEDIELSVDLCKDIKAIIKNRHLLVKIGIYKDTKKLKSFINLSKDYISGITSTNTLPMKIVTNTGKPTFGKNRVSAGVSGAAIYDLALSQATKIVKYKKELKLKDFVVIGVGGCTNVNEILSYLKCGVDAIQSATGAWHNPNLAFELKKELITIQ